MRTLLTCDISVGSIKLAALEAGDFVEIHLLYLPFSEDTTYAHSYDMWHKPRFDNASCA
jgi:hypothetical protein